MGYIHDTGLSIFFHPSLTQVNDGVSAWTDGTSSSVWWKARAAGAGAFTLKASLLLPHQHLVTYKGSRLTTVDIWYRVATGTLSAMDAYITQLALPANAAAWSAPALKNFTYGTDHDTTLERGAIAYHKMVLTLVPAFWVEYDTAINLELTCTASASALFYYYGCRANYTLRI